MLTLLEAGVNLADDVVQFVEEIGVAWTVCDNENDISRLWNVIVLQSGVCEFLSRFQLARSLQA